MKSTPYYAKLAFFSLCNLLHDGFFLLLLNACFYTCSDNAICLVSMSLSLYLSLKFLILYFKQKFHIGVAVTIPDNYFLKLIIIE